MTLDAVFLLLATIQLALVAYGVVGARRRLAGRPLLVAEALLVLLVPALIAALLAAAGEGAVVRDWGRFFIAMIFAGALTAALAEAIARRIDS